MTAPQALLEAAARCYLRGGDPEGACACFDRLGAWAEAASLHESAGRTREAADRYEKAKRHLDAARCHRASGDFAGEARCLVHAYEAHRAAWVLAHDLGRVREAQALMVNVTEQIDGEGATELVRARCDVVLGNRRAAARTLRATLPALRATSGPWRRRLPEWALAVAEALRRPDLGAEILATLEEGPGAEGLWDAWAQRTFGEAVAPPIRLDQEPLADVPGAARGWVHGDVAPENVVLPSEARPGVIEGEASQESETHE